MSICNTLITLNWEFDVYNYNDLWMFEIFDSANDWEADKLSKHKYVCQLFHSQVPHSGKWKVWVAIGISKLEKCLLSFVQEKLWSLI